MEFFYAYYHINLYITTMEKGEKEIQVQVDGLVAWALTSLLRSQEFQSSWATSYDVSWCVRIVEGLNVPFGIRCYKLRGYSGLSEQTNKTRKKETSTKVWPCPKIFVILLLMPNIDLRNWENQNQELVSRKALISLVTGQGCSSLKDPQNHHLVNPPSLLRRTISHLLKTIRVLSLSVEHALLKMD